MTLTQVLDLDLDILNVYVYTKDTFLRQGWQTLQHEQDIHPDTYAHRRDRTHYHATFAGGNYSKQVSNSCIIPCNHISVHPAVLTPLGISRVWRICRIAFYKTWSTP